MHSANTRFFSRFLVLFFFLMSSRTSISFSQTSTNRVMTELKFVCEICLNEYDADYRRPFVLIPCGHTLCNLCIDKIDNRQCPNDRIPFTDKVLNWEVQKRLPNFQIASLNNEIRNTFITCSLLIDDLRLLSQKKQHQFYGKLERLEGDKRIRIKSRVRLIRSIMVDEANIYTEYIKHFKRKTRELRAKYDKMNRNEMGSYRSEAIYRQFCFNLEKEVNFFYQNLLKIERNYASIEQILADVEKSSQQRGENGASQEQQSNQLVETQNLIESIDFDEREPNFESSNLLLNEHHESQSSLSQSPKRSRICPASFYRFSTRKKVILILLLTVALPVLLSLPVAMVTIGSIFLNECPINPKIPLWMILYGILGCLIVVFSIILIEYYFCKKRAKNSYMVISLLVSPFILCGLVDLFLFMIGNMIIFPIYHKVTFIEPTSTTYCAKLVYLLSFISLVIPYGLLGISLFACSLAVLMKKNDTEQPI